MVAVRFSDAGISVHIIAEVCLSQQYSYYASNVVRISFELIKDCSYVILWYLLLMCIVLLHQLSWYSVTEPLKNKYQNPLISASQM